MDIFELNERRANASLVYSAHGARNVATDPVERVKQDKAYRLAYDAWRAAEDEYQKALGSMTADQIASLASGRVIALQPDKE